MIMVLLLTAQDPDAVTPAWWGAFLGGSEGVSVAWW